MPYEVKYIDGYRGVTTRFYGEVTEGDLIGSCRERTASDELIVDLDYIFDDFMGAEKLSASPACIQECSEFAVNASRLNRRIHYVAAVPTDFLYGMARMFQAYAEETGWQINIVRSLEEAKEWVKASRHAVNNATQ